MKSGPREPKKPQDSNRSKEPKRSVPPHSTTDPSVSSKKIIVLKLMDSSSQKTSKTFKFDKERIVIGSVISADVHLVGDGVSPIHAVLESSGVIFDLASETGLFVNDQKVVTHTLSPQDQITIGRYRLKFSIEDFSKHQSEDRTRETAGRTLFLNPKEDLTPLLLEDEREVEEIFDYRPTSKQALEVVMSWFGTILGVEHFVHERSVTIGDSKRSDFGIPPLLSSNRYPIVTQKGGSFILNLDSQMKGVIHQNGELKSIDEVREQALRGPNGFEIPVGNNDFAKISIGDIVFYFSYTAAPPRLKMRRLFERDPFFFKIFTTSGVFTALLLLAIMKMNIPLSVDAEQVPERIATILYQPEKFLRPPPIPEAKPAAPVQENTPRVERKEPPQPKTKPKPIPTKKAETPPKPVETKSNTPHKLVVSDKTVAPVGPTHATQPTKTNRPVTTPPPKNASTSTQPATQNRPASTPQTQAKEGEGARAKGAEGSRGEKDKPKSRDKITELSRPSPHGGAKGAAGASNVSEEGNVDLLKGAGGRIQNILGNSAARLHGGSESLKGFGNFSTRGNGGLALSGTGQGGGGDAETTLGGLGKKGNGMGRVGTGKGAAGSGSGIVGGQARVAIQSAGPEETVVMGSIDRNLIAQAILAHKDEFRLCYEREINAEHPDLAGQVTTSFVIGSSGRVTQAGIESSSLNNANAERCVLKVLRRIDFPIPNGGTVEVRFPFKFSMVGR